MKHFQSVQQKMAMLWIYLLVSWIKQDCMRLKAFLMSQGMFTRLFNKINIIVPFLTVYDAPLLSWANINFVIQRTKKVVSDSLGLVDFAIRLVNSVLNLPNGQVMFFEEFKRKKNCEINSARQKAFRASWKDVWASNCCLQLARMASCKNDFLCPLLFELICCDLNYKSSFSLYLPLTIQENKHILILKRAVSFREGSKTRLRRAAMIKPGGNGRLA